MGTPLTSLELCLKILHVIQKTDEDDDIQIPLMEALKDAKQRDLAFIFDLCERAGDLRDDDELSEETLRAIAADAETYIEEEVSADLSSQTPQNEHYQSDADETINFDEMQAYQLRTRVLGLNMPSFLNLWKYLQQAGWTYNAGIYHIPRGKRRKAKCRKNSSGISAFALMDIDTEASSHILDDLDEGELDEEGPEEFTSSNDLVDYLDEYCMPDYRATPAEVQAQQKLLSTKSKAYQRRNKRLRWELLEVAFKDRLNERTEDDIFNTTSKYGHNNRSCEVCFIGEHPTAPRVACRECRLVVHTKCYGILDYGKGTTGNSKMKRADEKGLFICDVCDNAEGKISATKKETRWIASQSSGYRIHHHPNAICSICDSKSIAGGMIKLEGEEVIQNNKKGSDLEQWVHLFCLGAVLRQTGELSAVRTNIDVAAELREKLGCCKGKEICGLCQKKKGDIVKCRGQCGKYFHSLCIQIDRRNDTNYNSIDHLCSDCCTVDEANISQASEMTDTNRKRRTDETEQYFDKRPNKRQSAVEGEYAITIPTIKKCVSEAQKLQQANLSPSFGTIELSYQTQFKEWSYLLSTKQSILLHGLGSKKTVLSAFGEALSNEGDVLNINGYDEDIDLNQLFNYIDQIFLDGRVSVTTIDNSLRDPSDGLITKAVSIAKKFASMRSRPLFILIHTIDGVGLSDDFSQRSLQALTKSSEKESCRMIRLAASVDNINAAMTLWSPQVEHNFDWAWKLINTYRPFLNELQDGPQTTIAKKKQKITGTHKTGVAVLQVLSSLAPRHTEVLQQLVAIQQANANNLTPYADLKQACVKKMITSSDTLLRNILNELSDHNIIYSEKDEDGNECLYVPSQLPLNDIVNFKRST